MSSPTPISPFEGIRHQDDAGEYWSARELSSLLDYTEWRNFDQVVKKAKIACEKSGQRTADHFVDVNKMIPTGKGAQRQVKDYHLSRYGCYLLIENADPEKEIVALGQTYFAVRTRRDELATASEEDRRRVGEREKLKRYHRVLYRAARVSGVLTPEDFAIFEDHGYRGLYHETAAEIAARKGLRAGQSVSDYMGTVELAANGFRAALAGEMLTTEGVADQHGANATHQRAGAIVRHAIEEAGVPPPEALPTPDRSVQQVKRALLRQERVAAEDRLGLWALLSDGDQAES